MARTEHIYLQGKVKWFRPIQPDMQYDPPSWSQIFYPNEESLNKIRDLQAEGVKNVLKKDEDGFFVRLKRPTYLKKIINNSESKVALQPPEVVIESGGAIVPFKDMVGNGSDVTNKMEVYQHATPGGGKAKAMRWLASKIDNLIPFEKRSDFTTGEAQAVENLDKQPQQTNLF